MILLYVQLSMVKLQLKELGNFSIAKKICKAVSVFSYSTDSYWMLTH